MKLLSAALIFIWLSLGAAAQQLPQPADPSGPAIGHTDDVSLRDLLAAGIASLRQVMDERDRQYSQRFDAQEKAVAAALANAKEATTKAENAATVRADSQNEFRQTLTDQANTFMSKAEADARIKANADQLAALANAEKADIAALTLSTNNDLALLTARLDEERNRDQGESGLWIKILGVIGVVVLLINLAVNINSRRPVTAAK